MTTAPDFPLLDAPEEPILDLANIQGIAVPGFFKPNQALICVRHSHATFTVDRVRRFIGEIAEGIATGHRALDDRIVHRNDMYRRKSPASDGAPRKATEPLVAIAFTHCGLRSLMDDAEVEGMNSEAFSRGMVERSALLGDPTNRKLDGHPSNWKVGRAGREIDFMIVVAGDDETSVQDAALKLKERINRFSKQVQIDYGKRLLKPGDDPATAKGREHFGFVDGISQPGIRGRRTPEPKSYITERVFGKTSCPVRSLQGLPGQALVWPGEFVIGYPKSGPDPRWPGPLGEPERPWMMDGSFLVYRRLRQDVRNFRNELNLQTYLLRKLPGFRDITPEELAARLFGRHPGGAPLSRPVAKNADLEALGMDRMANNDFMFDANTPPLHRVSRPKRRDIAPERRVRPAAADPLGHVCPLASHIRKVNPRDGASDVGGSSGIYSRRILRVGTTYGDGFSEAEPEGALVDRGVLFMCIQASIEDQFEFLQARWMNDDRRPKAPSGHDMIAGRNAVDADAVAPGKGDRDADGGRRCSLFGTLGQEAVVSIGTPSVTPTGGGYFFVPSLKALKNDLARGAPSVRTAP